MCSFILLASVFIQSSLLLRGIEADVTFAVDNVTENNFPFIVGTIDSVIRHCSGSEVVHAEVDRPEGCQFVSEYEDPFHSLVAAVQMAYAEHRPLVLSPDLIWVTILQGLAIHSMQPGTETCYKASKLSDAGKVSCATSDSVYQKVSEYIVASTTTPVDDIFMGFTTTDSKPEKMAGMAALAPPYEDNICYNRQMLCGIPRITLQGSSEDWDTLMSEVEDLLSECNLEWWLCALKPVLAEFASAAKGHVNEAFWKNIYRYKPEEQLSTGCWFVSGWIMTLYPYLASDTGKNEYTNNTALAALCQHGNYFNWSRKASDSEMCPMINEFPLLFTQNFPSGLSRIFFTCSESGDKMSVVSGFVGYCVHNITKAVHPVLGWFQTNESELCYLAGDFCKHDCACGAHGKCEKAETVGPAGFGGIIGGGDSQDKKSCKCNPGWRGHDCTQKCPEPSCGEYCSQLCEENEICNYDKGYCVPKPTSSTPPPVMSPTTSTAYATSTRIQPEPVATTTYDASTTMSMSVPERELKISESLTVKEAPLFPSTAKSDIMTSSVDPSSTDDIPMETSTPDNVLGVASNLTICEDLDTLQKAACSHDFVGIVRIKSIKNATTDIRGSFVIKDSKKSPFTNGRKRYYYQIPHSIPIESSRINIKKGERHILISDANSNGRGVVLGSTAILMFCGDQSNTYKSVDISNCG